MPQLNTLNPEQLIYKDDHLAIEVLGGIRLDRLDSMRTTLKMEHENIYYRHTLDLYNDSQVSKLIRRAAGKLELGMGSIIEAIEDLTEELEAYRLEERTDSAKEKKKVELSKSEIKEATKLLESENLLEKINELIGESGVIGEEDNRLLMYIIFTSRKMANPLHIISMGASGIGKSHLQETVAELIPEEDKIGITDLSESSFYYFETNELSHKLILIEDLDGANTALYPLRELQSKKIITKTIVEKTDKGPKTKSRTVKGPICVAGCTTRESIYEDNANRSFLIYIDSSKEQDQKVMQYQKQISAGIINSEAESQSIVLLKNSQRLLGSVKVINPFAELLDLPESVFKPRRTNSHYLHFIEAVTFLHQKQREQKVNKSTGEIYIETTLEDIENANYLLKDVLLKKSDRLSPACREYFEELKEYLEKENKDDFRNMEVRRLLEITQSRQKHYMSELINNFHVQIKSGNKNRGFVYEITSFKEYSELKKQINSVLDATLDRLKSAIKNK